MNLTDPDSLAMLGIMLELKHCTIASATTITESTFRDNRRFVVPREQGVLSCSSI